MERRESWHCGTVRAEAKMIGNRIVTYRWVAVLGCGKVNRPDAERCTGCGKKKGTK